MRHQLELLLTAIGFFTRLPVPSWLPWSPARLAPALAWLPLIGGLVGGLCALALALFSLVLPPAPAVLLSLGCGVLLTGAFHEDGFADSCDGLGGGWDKAQVLAIMKDSRIGSYGVIGIVLLLLTKAAALIGLAQFSLGAAVIALLLAHPLSRLVAVAIAQLLPYARAEDEHSKSAAAAQLLAPSGLALAISCGLLPLLLLPFAHALMLAGAALLMMLASVRLFRRRLGGYTGDLLGASQQASETVCYLLLLALVS